MTMTESKPPRAVGVARVPEPATEESPEPPTLDLTLSPPGGIPWRTARNWTIAGAAALVACLLVVGLVVHNRTTDAATVAAPLDGRRQAELYLASGTDSITIQGSDLGEDLFRAGTPGGDQAPEVVERDGRLELVPAGPVEIALSTRVRWQLTIGGGVAEQVVDMREGGLAGIEVTAGAGRIDLSLPHPDGTTPLRIGAGASELTLSVPAGVPVRARLADGAAEAVVDGVGHSGIAAGTVLTSGGWEQAPDRYRLEAAGLGRLVLERH